MAILTATGNETTLGDSASTCEPGKLDAHPSYEKQGIVGMRDGPEIEFSEERTTRS